MSIYGFNFSPRNNFTCRNFAKQPQVAPEPSGENKTTAGGVPTSENNPVKDDARVKDYLPNFSFNIKLKLFTKEDADNIIFSRPDNFSYCIQEKGDLGHKEFTAPVDDGKSAPDDSGENAPVDDNGIRFPGLYRGDEV